MYSCISTSYLAIPGVYISLVFKGVVLQQKKYKTYFSVSFEIIGEKVNLSYANVTLKNYVLTKNNFNQYAAIVSLLTANSWNFIIVQYLLHFFSNVEHLIS